MYVYHQTLEVTPANICVCPWKAIIIERASLDAYFSTWCTAGAKINKQAYPFNYDEIYDA